MNKQQKKLGRPISKKNTRNKKPEKQESSQNQEINNSINPIREGNDDSRKKQFEKIIGFFMEFFEEVRFKNGFVFNQQARARLKKENGLIQWKLQTVWQQKREKQKVYKIISDVQWPEQEKQLFISMCLHVSWIFDQESTTQLFTILKKVWDSCKENKNTQQQHKKLIGQIHRNENKEYNFFSFQFSKKCHINPSALKEGMTKLILRLIEQFKQMITKLN